MAIGHSIKLMMNSLCRSMDILSLAASFLISSFSFSSASIYEHMDQNNKDHAFEIVQGHVYTASRYSHD